MAEMNTLTRNNLVQYLSLVCQMEQNRYQQKQAIEQVSNQIRIFSNSSIPVKPVMSNKQSKAGGSVIFTILGLFLAYYGITSFVWGSGFYGLVLCGCSIVSLLKVADISSVNSKAKDANRKAEENYKQAMARYNKEIAHNNAQKRLAEYLKGKLGEMKSQLSVMDNDLNRAYSCDIIYPAYRNLVAVSSFYDYLSSNRCQTLEGHEGAYNLYNLESRLDKIITRLDVISSQLESIKYNQNKLYDLMKESNQKIDRLQGTIDSMYRKLTSLSEQASITNTQIEKLAHNNELTRFNTDQIRREIELRNRMDGILSYGWMN